MLARPGPMPQGPLTLPLPVGVLAPPKPMGSPARLTRMLRAMRAARTRQILPMPARRGLMIRHRSAPPTGYRRTPRSPPKETKPRPPLAGSPRSRQAGRPYGSTDGPWKHNRRNPIRQPGRLCKAAAASRKGNRRPPHFPPLTHLSPTFAVVYQRIPPQTLGADSRLTDLNPQKA